MKTINQVKVGDLIESPKNGKGMVMAKTARTISIQFENGNKVKVSYKSADAYFWPSAF